LYKLWDFDWDSHFFGLWTSKCSSINYWKGHLFSIDLFLKFCQKSIGHNFMGIFPILYPVPLIYVCIPLWTPHSLDNVAIYQVLKSGRLILPLYSSFSNYFSYSSSFEFHISFRLMLSISIKILLEVFLGIVLNLYVRLEGFDIFTVLCLSTHKDTIKNKAYCYGLNCVPQNDILKF